MPILPDAQGDDPCSSTSQDKLPEDRPPGLGPVPQAVAPEEVTIRLASQDEAHIGTRNETLEELSPPLGRGVPVTVVAGIVPE